MKRRSEREIAQTKSIGLLMSKWSLDAMLRKINPKTMTRRLRGLKVVNAEPEKWRHKLMCDPERWAVGTGEVPKRKGMYALFYSNSGEPIFVKCPWQIGDEIYCKEAWRIIEVESFGTCAYIEYYDGKIEEVYIPLEWRNKIGINREWRSPFFMPRWVARPELFRTINLIGCERVQEISEEDCVVEGIQIEPPTGANPQKPEGYYLWSEARKEKFFAEIARPTYIAQRHYGNQLYEAWRKLWNSLHARPKLIYGNSEWAEAFGWEDIQTPGCSPRQATSKDAVGYVSLPFSEEDGDHRTHIQEKLHHRSANPWSWVLSF